VIHTWRENSLKMAYILQTLINFDIFGDLSRSLLIKMLVSCLKIISQKKLGWDHILSNFC
jgi:hypothetical protein